VSQFRLTRPPHPLFAVIASTTGLVLVFLTPPLQVADEQCHLLRTLSFLDGHLLPARGPDGECRLQVPARVFEDVRPLFGETPFHPLVER
jgi:hypothetical protein